MHFEALCFLQKIFISPALNHRLLIIALDNYLFLLRARVVQVMPHFKHGTKKVLARASTSKKTLNTGLNAEFCDCRRRLDDVATAIRSLNKSIHSSREVWTTVARHQRDFVETLAASFPQPGLVQSHATEVEAKLRNVQMQLNDNDAQNAPHQNIASVLERYLTQLSSIQEDYPGVEMAYTEKMRYERKVDSLEKKRGGGKVRAALQRNLEKLTNVREDYDNKVHIALQRMRAAFEKHETVLQCAHHAFWIADHTFSSTINNMTEPIHRESMAVRDRLANLDVQEDRTLAPVPRVKMLTDALKSENESQQNPITVEHVDESEASVKSGTAPVVVAPPLSVLEATSDASPVSTVVSDAMGSTTAVEKVKRNIPEVPTEKPTAPTMTQSTTTTTTTVTPSATPIAV